MLILTRRVGETIVIGKEVFCTILGHDREGAFKVAIDAPKSVPINRFEIHRSILSQIEAKTFDTNLSGDETVLGRLVTHYALNQGKSWIS